MTPDNDLEKVAREIVKDTYLHNVGGNLSSSSAMMRRINLELRIFLALDAERLAERERAARIAETLEVQCGSEVKVAASPNQIATAIRKQGVEK